MDNLNASTAAAAVATTTTTAEAGAHTHQLGTTSTPTPAEAVAGAVAPATPSLKLENGNPTDYQIVLWAQEHGRKIKVIEVDGKLVCFKHPTRQIVEAANDILVKTKKASKYVDTIFANCQLNFIEEMKADDELYFAVTQRVDEIITSKVATLKN